MVSRANGMPTAANFTLAQTELPPLPDQQVLVRNHYLFVAPYMRGRMNEGKSYVPPFELGKIMEGGAVGEVIESRAKEFKAGDAVTSNRETNMRVTEPKKLLLQKGRGWDLRQKDGPDPFCRPDIPVLDIVVETPALLIELVDFCSVGRIGRFGGDGPIRPTLQKQGTP